MELEKSGNASISRARKKELKELHTSRLLAKTEPVPASIDVTLNSSTGLLYVGTNSRSFLDLFEEQLTKSFEVTPVRMTLAGLEEIHDLDEQNIEALMEQIYKTGMHGMQVSFDEHSYTVSEAGHAMLTSMGEDAMEVSSKNAPGTTDLSLESGMAIKKMKIAITRDGEEDLRWELILNNDFSFSQLKTPAANSHTDDDDADAVLLEKLYLTEQAVGIMHTLFRQKFGE